ncbi:hypothetical protein M3Y98_00959000 [Aphelenchoides besseyi]|nr:hypothetical protein M3Y98_00959000 [Aphelenchoides besseyi]KAI6194655.1 hypothetical protein M3Y96_01147600 [Aphelenchoides besseyi]
MLKLLGIGLLIFVSASFAFNSTTNNAYESLLAIYPNMSTAQQVQFDEMVRKNKNETDETFLENLEDFAENLGDGLKAAYRDIRYGLEIIGPYVEMGFDGLVDGVGWIGNHAPGFLKSVVSTVKSGYKEAKQGYEWIRDVFSDDISTTVKPRN